MHRVVLDGDGRGILGNLIHIRSAKALTPGLLHTGMDASSPNPDRRFCFDVVLVLISCSDLATQGVRGSSVVVSNDGIGGMAVEWADLLCHASVLKPLTHTLQPDVVIVEATVAVAGVCGEEVWTLSVLAYFGPKHLTLVRIWGHRDTSKRTKMNVNNKWTTASIPMKDRWFSTEETFRGSSPLPWGHSLLKSSKAKKKSHEKEKKKNQWLRWSSLVFFFLGKKWGLHTSPWDRTSVDLTVVPPACPHRAAALLLGGVPGQNVIAEVCVV